MSITGTFEFVIVRKLSSAGEPEKISPVIAFDRMKAGIDAQAMRARRPKARDWWAEAEALPSVGATTTSIDRMNELSSSTSGRRHARIGPSIARARWDGHGLYQMQLPVDHPTAEDLQVVQPVHPPVWQIVASHNSNLQCVSLRCSQH